MKPPLLVVRFGKGHRLYVNITVELVDEDTNQCKIRKRGRPPTQGFRRYVIFHPPVVMIYKKQKNRIPEGQTNSRHVCVCRLLKLHVSQAADLIV